MGKAFNKIFISWAISFFKEAAGMNLGCGKIYEINEI
jgi:hypothetical protein